MESLRPAAPVLPALLPEFSQYVAAAVGLWFPPERWPDLARSVGAMARENHFTDAEHCMASLMAHPARRANIDLLARYLSIGETYFFRDPGMFGLLEQEVLLPLIETRRAQGNRCLRLWSAACCSGEEVYTLAILLDRLIPRSEQWSIEIVGTDIQPAFLRKARAGVYKEWSFRDVPAWVKQACFTRAADGNGPDQYEILPELKRHVSFEFLNLAGDDYSRFAGERAADLIVCRNVLMYFDAQQFSKTVAKLKASLVEGGWLVVSPIESSQQMFGEFEAVVFPGATFYRKNANKSQRHGVMHPAAAPQEWEAPAALPVPSHAPIEAGRPSTSTASTKRSAARPPAPSFAASSADAKGNVDDVLAKAEHSYRTGQYSDAVRILLADGRHDLPALTLLAKACANCGELQEARCWIEQAVGADRCDARLRYLMAVIQEEQGEAAAAAESLRQALYLDQDFALAHFSLGGLQLRAGKSREAKRQYRALLEILARAPPEELVPESDGLTVGRLMQIVREKESRL